MPLLVKIAPDLADDDVLAVADLAVALGLDGIIATNTTIRRDGLRTAAGAGRGRSAPAACPGAPLHRARARGAAAAARPGRRRPDAGRGRRHHHASRTPAPGSTPAPTLLQGYTAFIYEGPLWPRRIVRGLDGPRDGAPA